MSTGTGIEWTVEFRDVEGFPGYRVGDDGSVWSCWTYNGHSSRKLSGDWKRLAAQPDGDGYLAVGLYRGGRCYRRKVHLLVLQAFVGSRPLGLEGCHNDGCLVNCAVGNLRWDTHAANISDRVRHGTAPRGTKNGLAKLDNQKVLEIKRRLAVGERQAILASEFQVGPSTISGIKNGRLWSWLQPQ